MPAIFNSTYVTPTTIARTAIMLLRNRGVAYPLMRSPEHLAMFTGGEKKGSSVRVRVPPIDRPDEFTGTAVPRVLAENFVDVPITSHLYRQVPITAAESTFTLDDLSRQVLAPIINGFANQMSEDCMAVARQCYNWSGVPGTPINTNAQLSTPISNLDQRLVDGDNRHCILSPLDRDNVMEIDIIRKANERGDAGQAFRTNQIGFARGINWWMDQAARRHTAGLLSGDTPTVSGAVAAGANIVNFAGGTGTNGVTLGDRFTVTGVVGQFVVTNTTPVAGIAGAVNGVTFSPAAPASGFPAGNGVTILGDHNMNLMFHPAGISAVAFAPAPPISTTTTAVIPDPQSGMSVRVVTGWSNGAISDMLTIDMFFGVTPIDQRMIEVLVT